MTEAAPANADPGRAVPAPRQAARRMGIQEAADVTGLSVSTIQRRLDWWTAGHRDDYALKGGRKGAHRYCDAADVEALVRQIEGKQGPNRHARRSSANPTAAHGA